VFVKEGSVFQMEILSLEERNAINTLIVECGCKNDHMNCFCRNGVCVQENWECHEKRDCNKMRKCKSVDCRCSYNDLCEPVECTTTQQCINQGASCVDQYEGYTCKCEKNVCGLTLIVQRY